MRWYNSQSESINEIFDDVKLFSYLKNLGFLGKTVSYLAGLVILCFFGIIIFYNIPALLTIMLVSSFGLKIKIRKKEFSLVQKIIFILILSVFSTGVYLILNLLGFSGGRAFI